jgi:hypothetical protein
MTNAIIFIGLAVAYAAAKIILEKRLAPLDDVGEGRRLTDLAFASGRSAYELFQAAGAPWKFSQAKIDDDFKHYLHHDDVPSYVSRYVRSHRQCGDRTYQRLLFSGGRPPYL